MTNVKTIALTRAITLLKGAGYKFIIVDDNDVQHVEGDLALAERRNGTKRRAEHREYGALSAHFRPMTDTMQVGDVLTIPYGPFDSERECLRSSIASHVIKMWGKGAAITHCNDQGVEVLRLA